MEITFETNKYGRTFLLVNGIPSYTSWEGEAPQIKVVGKKVMVNGKAIQLPQPFKGAGDNRHRNWRTRK